MNIKQHDDLMKRIRHDLEVAHNLFCALTRFYTGRPVSAEDRSLLATWHEWLRTLKAEPMPRGFMDLPCN
jgi:hypothetical protein